jgi:cytochrome c peroxidase
VTLLACGLAACLTMAVTATPVTPVAADAARAGAAPRHSGDCGGEPCDAVLRGLRGFLDRPADGNGRACADCHMPIDQFQLSPASVEARFQLLQWRRRWNRDADDPLFRPIDADDFRSHGDAASDFSNLRQHALIRVTLPLPPNVRLIDPSTNAVSDETMVDVWRMVPSVSNVALTGPDVGSALWPRQPNVSGAYQLDARVTTLQAQAHAAFLTHAELRSEPASRLLDDLASFQRTLFSNHRVRGLADAVRAGVTPLPDVDARLTELEAHGKAAFVRACSQCHGGPGQSTPTFPVTRYSTISSQCPRPVDTATPARFAFAPCPPQLARNARTYEIVLSLPTQTAGGLLPAGTRVRRASSDPGRALLTGFVGGAGPQDDWDKLDVPTLHGIRRTAPYFHNNSAGTLEAVVDHYVEFFKRIEALAAPGVVSPAASTDGVRFDRIPRPDERAALLAYLRTL